MVMRSSKNLRVFNFTHLLKLQKFDAREIYVFYSIFQLQSSLQLFSCKFVQEIIVCCFEAVSVCQDGHYTISDVDESSSTGMFVCSFCVCGI